MASKQPQPRFLHATTGAGLKFYVWGGHGGHSAKIQTTTFECFDVCTESWQQPQVFRSSHYGMAVASDGERVYTFGGETDSDYVCTLYEVDLHSYQCKENLLDMKKWHWTKLKVTGAKPPARSFHTTCCIAGPLNGQGQQSPLLMVVGGYSGSTMGDVWLLNVDKGIWNEVTLPEAITPRDGHSAAVFGSRPNFKVVVLFGGWSGAKYLSETTLLTLEFSHSSWKVTDVVKSDGLGIPDSIMVQMTKLQFTSCNGVGGRRSTVADIASASRSAGYRGTSANVSPTEKGGEMTQRSTRRSSETARPLLLHCMDSFPK